MTHLRSGRFEAIARIVLLVVFAAGFLGHCFAQTRPLMLSLTPYLLLGNAFLVLFPLIRERNARVLLWCLTASACGFLIEAIGVHTGVVFGAYSYGAVLGPLLLSVPLLIGLNWALIILGSVELAGRLARGPFTTALCAGILTALFDWIMEPWAWATGRGKAGRYRCATT
jgi:putative membrane protein